ncbi:Dihydrofolate reductase [Sphaceloma murrayae]|uniref:Dihydrofolate reductase n=1 Tax=Sphaceloma murrayae TaxID=2082308 RepID=A0A2K1QH97_9PEZI|nr:Dihydrofolate reductase [Sphaceloma murrayae]
MGTSAEIFQAQLSRVLPVLQGQGHEFVFVDGLQEYIKLVYPPPYLAYYPIARPDLVREAQAYMREVIEDEGPFDGVMGFSQGAALAASLVLEHAKYSPLTTLFKFAVFICGTLPFNVDDENGLEMWQVTKAGNGPYAGEFAGEIDAVEPLGFPNDLEGTILGRYHPTKNLKVRIGIPTVHVIGKADAYAMQSKALSKLCQGDVTILEHEEGHRVPRDDKGAKLIAKAVENMIRRVRYAQ